MVLYLQMFMLFGPLSFKAETMTAIFISKSNPRNKPPFKTLTNFVFQKNIETKKMKTFFPTFIKL